MPDTKTKYPFYAYATSPRANAWKRPLGAYGVGDWDTREVLAGPFGTVKEAEDAADKMPGVYAGAYLRHPLPGSRFSIVKAETA